MNFTLSDMIRRAWASLFTPRDVAQDLIALRLDRAVAWQLLLAVVLVSVVVTEATSLVFTAAGLPPMGTPISGPLPLAVVQASLMVLMVFAIVWIGRAFGGQGEFADAIVLVAWLQFVLLCLQVAQMVVLLLMPILAFFIGVLGIVLFFWLLTQFVTVLHGFTSPGRVFGMIVATFIALGFVMMLVFTMIGLQVPEV